MVDEKLWYHSTTIWGSLLSVAAALAGAIGISVDAATQNELADIMVQLVGTLGAMIAIYGRLTATEVIS